MTAPRLPWEVVETFPASTPEMVQHWRDELAAAPGPAERIRALVGRALSTYWASHTGAVPDTWNEVEQRRRADVAEAESLARALGDADLLATALLGRLYALWGPDSVAERSVLLGELSGLVPELRDVELCLRVHEWKVLEHFDAGELSSVRTGIHRFVALAPRGDPVLFARRERLWQANLAMLTGRIAEAIELNQEAISATADAAGTPLSFQNVAITLAIERFFRRQLVDVLEPIRSIRAASPRVATNWDVGLAFALSESGDPTGALELFDSLAAQRFGAVPRDLNWLVTMQLLALVSIRNGGPSADVLLEALRPYGHLDATHGSGYASYGPVGRVVGSLAALTGDLDEARRWFDHVEHTREPGPWTSLTKLDRARALRDDDRDQARESARRAAEELRSLGLDRWAEDAAQLALELRVVDRAAPLAHLRGGTWTLRHPAGTARVDDGKGVRLLVSLLGRPGEALAVTELDPDIARGVPGDELTEAALDRTAVAAYTRRLRELEGRHRLNDAEVAERDFLRRELAGSRFQPAVSPEAERARVRVTKAIRRTVAAVGESSPSLGAHLDETIETGRRCLYAPADGTGWKVVRDLRSAHGGGR